MSPTIGYAVLPIIPSLKGAQAAINQQLGAVMPASGARAGDQLGTSMKSSLGKHARDLAGVISTGILATSTAVAAGSVAIGKLGLSLASQQEQAEVSFSAILGDGEAAQQMLKDLADFAAATPFELPGLRTSASQLLAVGVEADRVIPIMETLGDATAGMGTGAEGIQRAVRALTQMEQKGKVSAEEMLQLAEAGVPAWEALATTMGVSVAQAQDAVTKGQVQVEQVFTALEQKAGPTLQRLTGLMDQQSQTLEGLFSTFKDTTGQQLAEAFRPTVDELKKMLPLLTDASAELIDRFAPAVASVAGEIADFLPPLVDGLDSGLDLLEKYAPALAGISGAILGFGKSKIPFIGDLIPGGPLALGLAGLIAATPEARDAVADLVDQVGPLVVELADKLAPILGDISDLAGSVLPPAIHLTADALSLVLEIALPLADAVAGLTGFLADHEEIVYAVATAWAAWKVQAAGTAIWTSLTTGATAVQGLAGSLVYLRGAIASVAATQGVSQLAAGMGVLKASMAGAVSGMTIFGGALAGIVVGAAAASYAIDKLHESGSRDANTFLDSLNADPSTIATFMADTSRIQGRINELTAGLNNNPFDASKTSQELADLTDQLNSNLDAIQDTNIGLYKMSRQSGVSRDQIESIATAAGIDLVGAFDKNGKASDELTAAIADVGAAAKITGTDLQSIELTPEQVQKMEADAKRIQAAMDATAQSFQSFGDLLSLTDDPVDPKQIEAAEKAVRTAKEQVAEAEKAHAASEQTADELERSARALRDAKENLSDTEQALRDLKASDSPLDAQKIKEFYFEQIQGVRDFKANLETAMEAGFDPALISRLIQAGPEQAGPVLEALVSDTSGAFVSMVNAAEDELADLSTQAVEMARITEIAVSNHSETGQQMVRDLADAQAIALATLNADGTETIEQLAAIAEVQVSEFKRIADEYGISLEGLKGDSVAAAGEVTSAWTNAWNLVAGQIPTGGGGSWWPDFQPRASGGPFAPGWVLAGEQGPELMHIGSPGFVIDAGETAKLLAGAKESGKSGGGSGSSSQSWRRPVGTVVMGSTQDERAQQRWLLKHLGADK